MIIRLFPGIHSVAMEGPGYNGTRAVFQSHNFRILLVPVGEKGIDIHMLSDLSAPMVYVAPSLSPHCNPSTRAGESFTSEPFPRCCRRACGWPMLCCRGTCSLCIRKHSRAIPALCRFWSRNSWQDSWKKQLKKVCLAHKKKHNILVSAITQEMGDRVCLYGRNAGLHLLPEFTGGANEGVLLEQALSCACRSAPRRRFGTTETLTAATLLCRVMEKSKPQTFCRRCGGLGRHGRASALENQISPPPRQSKTLPIHCPLHCRTASNSCRDRMVCFWQHRILGYSAAC